MGRIAAKGVAGKSLHKATLPTTKGTKTLKGAPKKPGTPPSAGGGSWRDKIKASKVGRAIGKGAGLALDAGAAVLPGGGLINITKDMITKYGSKEKAAAALGGKLVTKHKRKHGLFNKRALKKIKQVMRMRKQYARIAKGMGLKVSKHGSGSRSLRGGSYGVVTREGPIMRDFRR